jgi:hypothetical protein
MKRYPEFHPIRVLGGLSPLEVAIYFFSINKSLTSGNRVVRSMVEGHNTHEISLKKPKFKKKQKINRPEITWVIFKINEKSYKKQIKKIKKLNLQLNKC